MYICSLNFIFPFQLFILLFIAHKMASSLRQTPLTCSGHTRPVVHVAFSKLCTDGYYLISACKGINVHILLSKLL